MNASQTNTSEPISLGKPLLKQTDAAPSAFERMRYLCPSRYFHFYMLHERTAHRTCWLPEGYES